MQLIEQVRNQVTTVLASLTSQPEQHAQRVTATRDAALGDYQANVVFALAKELSRQPEELAQEIAADLRKCDLFEHVSVAGKGFINMRMKPSLILDLLVTAASDGRCGVDTTHPTLTYVVDFSSPNVAKPMHVGHIRSTVIGDAIAKMLRFVGHHVITDNHLGDWGTQFGMIIYGFKNFVDQAAFEKSPVEELSRLYRLTQQLIEYQKSVRDIDAMITITADAQAACDAAIAAAAAKPNDKALEKASRAAQRKLQSMQADVESVQGKMQRVQADATLKQLADQHTDIEAAALRETALLHAGDAGNLALWNQFMPQCLSAIQGIYDQLNVSFDYQLGESFYHDRLAPVVEELKLKNLATQSEGAVCVFLDGFDAPMIIQKNDGAFLYATTDLATVAYRIEKFDPDAILYVVDHRQSEHFQKLFAVLRATGCELDLRHISFGTVLGKDGKPFKTRSGDSVGLESLLQEAIDRAHAIVCDPERLQKASLQMDDAEKEMIATSVGLGAIKYADLSHNRTSDYVFDLEKMVQLEGNTATYIQYSCARASSILRKLQNEAIDSSAQDVPSSDQIEITHPVERTLAIQLLRFEEAIHVALADFQPNILADYLYETARQFASFFDQCPVAKAESEIAGRTRRLLVNLTRQVLSQGLDLLGISVIERM